MWRQLIIDPGELDPDALEEALLESGAQAVTLQEGGSRPILEPEPGEHPLWDTTHIVALFDAGTDVEEALRAAIARLGLDTPPEHRVETLQERDWERAWLEDFQPMRFGGRLWICPSGSEPPEPEAAKIILDPGLAFGTGTHETTALCLEWLDAVDPQGWEMVDYGCGSGILALAAARLGAQRVWAVDNDPQALLATRENARRNGLADSVLARLPEELPPLAADALVANILSGPLVTLAPRFAGLLRPGGRIALSGILVEQESDIRAAYDGAFALDEAVYRNGWARLSGYRVTTAGG